MNYKRAIVTGVMLWILIFVAISILMFIPFLIDKKLTQFAVFWVFLVPTMLLLAKWHFKMDPPNVKKGLLLGVIVLLSTVVLDVIITIPLFVKSYSVFFSDWMMYVGYVEILVLCIFAGWEFDKTFTKHEDIKIGEGK